MSLTITVQVNLDHWEKVGLSLRTAMQQAVDQTANEMEMVAKLHVPVDTGTLRRSIYAATPSGNDYDAGANQGNAAATLYPPEPTPPALSALMAVAASYGTYVEYGTTRAPAQPFFEPAVEIGRRALPENIRKALADVR